jgi:hypothetical protein
VKPRASCMPTMGSDAIGLELIHNGEKRALGT